MAKYVVNKRGVAKARELIDAGKYRVRSRSHGPDRLLLRRAAEWEHAKVMVAAHNLILYLDKSRD